jgi:hypothetical protein
VAPAGPAAGPAAPPVPNPPRVDPYAPQQVPGAPTYYPPAYPARTTTTDGLAVAALVTGIVGAFLAFFYALGFLPALAAIITGHIAQRRKNTPKGFWVAGLICGYVGLAISLVWIAAIIVFIVFAASNPSDF